MLGGSWLWARESDPCWTCWKKVSWEVMENDLVAWMQETRERFSRLTCCSILAFCKDC